MLREVLVGLLVVGLTLSLVGAPAATTAESGYDITIPGSIETPPRDVTIEGETHTVSAVARTAPGNSLSVTVTAPSDASYRVFLYNGDRHIADKKDGTGDQTVAFDLTSYDPGSYLVAVYKDGDYKAVHPVVVRSYSVTLDGVPSRTTTGSEIDVTVELTNEANADAPQAVKVVLTTDDQDVQVTASKTAAQTYAATISLDTFAPGDARLYAVVQGSETAFKEGRKELLGISDATTFTVYEPTTTTTATTTSTTTPEATTTTTTAPPTTVTTTTTQLATTETISSTEATTTPRTSTFSPTTTQATSEAVITPNQSTFTVTPSTNSPSIPGFTPVHTAIGVLCALYLAARRLANERSREK